VGPAPGGGEQAGESIPESPAETPAAGQGKAPIG